VEKAVNQRRAHLAEPQPGPVADAPPVVQPLPEKKIVTRLREHHAAVDELLAQGLSKAAM
jgi:hypothetical protein